MTFIDLLLIVIILAFVFFGLFFGLLHTLGSLFATIISVIIASHFVNPAFDTFGFMLGGGQTAKVITFIFLFFITSRLLALLMKFFGGVFYWFTYIPFANTFNRLLGGLFGLLEGVIVVGVIIFYAMQILPDDTLLHALQGSLLAKYLVAIMSALQVFFPETLKTRVKA
ncbi:CvpA family protein [Candidatus Uhrbacteria bacterium]|nr:CvpA family protein [Candidatus Uhrbacteria bacterium]